ncbi:hypothetical protein L873DRAFT_1787411 [Choiromyces venosus 120613-1]|uniref:Uncharacterized protein n=1 Tax=Choiromyces venosus 120613-1 TaxID=1336337 RepID=A0A3N4JX85_9PEZI|nr:hypothetical protein L873DRAFT_1787411 [Choiromyces venosus 120613-1]
MIVATWPPCTGKDHQAALGSCAKANTSKSSKNNRHKTSLTDSCTAEDQRMDGVEQQMMPSACPCPNGFGVMTQPPVSHAREEAERIKTNKSVFAWINTIAISAGHMWEARTRTSPVTNNSIDLFTANLSCRQELSKHFTFGPAHQLPVHNSSGISISDLDCDYSGPPVPDLKHTTVSASLNSAPTGDLSLINSDDDALQFTKTLLGTSDKPQFFGFFDFIFMVYL